MAGHPALSIIFVAVAAYVVSPLWLATPAKLLSRLGRNRVASHAYRLAAALAPPWATDFRAAWLARASAASFHAGEMDDAVALGMRALDVPTRNVQLTLGALTLAANALGSHGDPRAEELWRRMLHEANRAGLAPEVAIAQAGLGGYLKRRARYDEAEPLLRQALTQQRAARIALTTLAEMQLARGDHEDALRTWSQLEGAAPVAPHYAAQSRGVVAFGRARTYVEMGRLDQAETFLQQAEVDWAAQERLRRWCLALRTELEARRGRTATARALLEPLVATLPSLTSDHNSTTAILGTAAGASFALGEFARGRELVARYFAARPNEEGHPRMHYCDGMCALGAGDVAGAVAAFERAARADSQFDYARKAKDKLIELGVSSA